jgi:uncharacterized protein (TIGR02147 family)
MKEQLAIQNLLRAKLTEIQKTNPQYSLRAYSKKVGVHVGALSSILNGKRNVSRELAERITTKLMLDPQERSEILCHFPEKRRYQKSDLTNAFPDPRYLEFNASQFKVVAEWEHFAVMSLLNCEGFQGKVSWISGRLGITETRATQVIQRLLELGLFSLNENGEITRSKQSYRTSDDVADLSLKKVRDFTSITMAIDPRKLSMAKERIRKFQDELSDLLEEGTRTEVYRLSMQVFPLSKLKVGELK